MDLALTSAIQALLVLVYLRKCETFADVGAGFGVSTTTAWRYINRFVMLLSARSPRLDCLGGCAWRPRTACRTCVLDGTLIPINRLAADRSFYSGQHPKHGMNIQVIATGSGDMDLRSAARQRDDLRAARIWGILRALQITGLVVPADKGYNGAGEPLLIPYKGKNEPEPLKDAKPLPCQTPPTRRTRERPAQELANPPQAALLPIAPDTSPRPSTSYRPAKHTPSEEWLAYCSFTTAPLVTQTPGISPSIAA